MKVFITGGTGFIGSYLVINLVNRGEEVTVFDLKPQADIIGQYAEEIEIIQGDLLDFSSIKEIIFNQKPAVVVHLAAYRNTESQKKPYGAFRLNCEGTVNILEACHNAGVERVVYASSVAVYGSPDFYRKLKFDPYRFTEEAPPKPHNVYGVTKVLAEGMAKQYEKVYRMKTIGLRLSIIFGPGKKTGSLTSIYNDLIEKPLMGEPASISSYANQVLNLLYVKDAAHALLCACYAPNPKSSIYNIGGSLCRTRDLVNTILNVIPTAKISVQDSDMERPVASGIDSQLAKDELSYQPQFDLEQAIIDFRKQYLGLTKN